MILTLDNLDGLGALDYSPAVDASEPLAIRRALNQPARLTGSLCLAASTLRIPARRARVIATSDAGAILFTGYLTLEPVPVYAGEASAGPVFRYALDAASDEWLLDKQSAGALFAPGLQAYAGDLLNAYAARLDAAALATGSLVTSGTPVTRATGVQPSAAGGAWSTHAGAAAGASYAAYRALSRVVTLTPLASVAHTFTTGEGTLALAALATSQLRELANDVTITGADEPSTYWTELFTGDGTTALFPLLGEPTAPSAAHTVLLAEPFNEPAINLQLWQVTDPGSFLSLSDGGLGLSGGNGLDGQTTLIAWDPVELGGTLVLELGSVLLTGLSAGVLGGLYDGPPTQPNCFAGFNLRQSGGNTLCTSLVNGVETGSTATLVSGHAYTLRLRLHAPELLRARQTFYAFSDASGSPAVNRFGTGFLNSAASLVFELRDQGLSSNTPATVLYDGAVTTSPASLTVAAVNSLQLFGSIGSLHLNRTGTAWVRSTRGGTLSTRLIGTAAQGADCGVTSNATGTVTFFPGRIPAAGELITVTYRGRRRSVARVADPVSLAAEAAGGAIGSARWLGHVTQPPARSSEDCENAAIAILSFAASRAAALSGKFTAINPATTDLWPGDLLSLNQGGNILNALIRTVTVSTQGAAPEALTYHLGFANEWAEALGLTVSETLPADALVPYLAQQINPDLTLPPSVLANLPQVTVTGPSGGFLTVDAGVDPPTGGGFEVRRRNGGFGAASTGSPSGDLVLRSPVRSFAIPVDVAPETFYLRAYDSATPPLYSRFSSAIVSH